MEHQTFNQWLAEYRRTRGFSVAEIAARSNRSGAAVHTWLHGHSVPDDASVAALAEGLALSATERAALGEAVAASRRRQEVARREMKS